MTIQHGHQDQQQQPVHKVRLLRLKRKRDESIDDALVVEAVPGSEGAAAAMGRLDLGPQPQAPQTGGKRYRFVRLPGVQASDLEDLSPAQLSRLVTGQLAGAVAAEPPGAQMGGEPAPASSSPMGEEGGLSSTAQKRTHWYQQVSAPAAPDATCGRHPAVLDLVRREIGEGADNAGDDSFVTDVYATVESDNENGDIAAAWEAHLAGRAPVVQVMDDGTWLVHETQDPSSSSDESEDSNAEGHYTHDYPDAYSESGDSGDYDPDLGYFAPPRRRRGGHGMGSSTASDASSGGEDDIYGGFVRRRHVRAQYADDSDDY